MNSRRPLITRRHLLAAAPFAGNPLFGASFNAGPLETPYKLNKLVLAGSGVQGDFDSKSVDCPYVFRYRDLFYMTYVAFDGTGYQTGLASSSNLVEWRKEGCIMKRDPASAVFKYNVALNWILRDNDMRGAGTLKPIDGEFVGAYHAYPNAGYEKGAAVIGICRSKDLQTWRADPPSLFPNDGAAWERGGLYKPCLVEHAGVFYLFYNAKNRTDRDWREQTGVAVSKDLRNWSRFEGNPLVRNGAAGSPDERFASDPCVLKDRDRWVLFYFGLSANGVARELVATGATLTDFSKCDRILIDVGPPGSIDSRYAHKPSVLTHEGVLYHFYCAVTQRNGVEVRGISVARSRPW